MISDNITITAFIIQVLERDIQNIYKAQLAIAQHNIYVSGRELEIKKRRGSKIGVRSGSLLQSLQNPDYLMHAQDEKFTISAFIVKHMRFIDMKKYGDRGIYNRQVWGILYNNALKDIRYNYGNAVTDYLGTLLHDTFGHEHGASSENSSGKRSSKSKRGKPWYIVYAKVKGRIS